MQNHFALAILPDIFIYRATKPFRSGRPERFVILCIVLGAIFTAPMFLNAQTNATALDWPTFRQTLMEYNPLVRQANLFRNRAQSGLLRAKGGFDLKSYGDFETKSFQQKNYFRYTEAGVKLPTMFGLELKANYNWVTGININPESTIPQAGQLLAGFSWTLGQGLMIDERRADLRTARIGLQQGEAERALALNDLVFMGAKSYWTWVLAQNQLRIFRDARLQALIRMDGIRENFRFGDKAAIDTVETLTQLQQRDLDLSIAEVDSINSRIDLTNFMWGQNDVALSAIAIPPAPELLDNAIRSYTDQEVNALCSQLRQQHPKLRNLNAKLQMLDIERRMKVEKTKPIVDLNYNILGNGMQFFDTRGPNGEPVTYIGGSKWGINVSYPIQNRKARGDLQITQVKIAQTTFEQTQIIQEIENKVRQYANELNNLARQISVYRGLVANLRALLDGENEKFRFGDSSIFLINSREQKWLEARIKYLKLLSEYRKAEAGLEWAAGQLGQ